MKVSEIMKSDPTFCTAYSSSQEAAELMQKNGVGILPVTESFLNRKLVGVVTDRDLCRDVLAAGRSPKRVPIHECMTRDPAYCHVEDDVDRVIRTMAQHKIRRVPVVDDGGKVRGIVGLSDLVRHRGVSPSALFDLLEKIYEPVPAGKPARTILAA